MTAQPALNPDSNPDSNTAIVLFDGECNLCSFAVQFILERDPSERFRFASLQSPRGQALFRASGVPGAALDSIVLVSPQGVLTRSDAALAIAAQLCFPWPFLGFFRWIPRTLRDAIYDWIARNRYRWFGRRATCWLPTPELSRRFLD